MLEIGAYFDEVIYGDVMGTPRQSHVEFLEAGDVGFGQYEAPDAQLGDTGGENILLQSRNGPKVNVMCDACTCIITIHVS